MTILGVDVSKDTIDVTLRDAPKGKEHHQFANNKSGFRALRKWLGQCNISKLHVCMEATNIYGEALASFCYDEGWQVSVVNPVRIKGFAKSQMRRNKTDPEERKLRDLLRHQHALQKTLTQQTNRLHTCQNEVVCNSLHTIIGVLRTEITQVEDKIQSLLQSHPDLKQRFDFLRSIKGIGSKTALFLLAEMHDLANYENARAAAADAGVTPSHYQSGTSVKRRTKISKIGKAGIRAALYWPAITAIQHNPLIKAMAERLKARGKSQKVIIGAAMPKLLHLAYGVLNIQSYFDPYYAR